MSLTPEAFQTWLAQPDARRCVLVVAGVRSGGVETTRYLSNKGYVSTATDTPANQTFMPHITGGVTVSESLPEDGTASIAWGDIELANAGGALDPWLNDVWAGRPVIVYVGDVSWPFADFQVVFTGLSEDITASSRTSLNLLIRDSSQRLNTPLTDALVGGTGPNAQAVVPLCFGEAHNVSPVLVDAGPLKYRVHAGPIEHIIEVRDNGAPVPHTANLADGTFTLAYSPVGEVTASVQGAKPAGQYLNTVAALVRHIATTYGPAPLTALEVDDAAMATFAAAHTQPVGLYAKDRTNVLAVCQELAASVGAQVAFDAMGRLYLAKIDAPTALLAGARAITPADILAGTTQVSRTPKFQTAVRLDYCKNWTVQDKLAAGLPATHASLFAQEWLTAQATNPATAELWRQSTTPPTQATLLLVPADAQAEAERRLEVWGERRQVYRATAWAKALHITVGSFMTLFDDRFGLQAGKPGQVVARVVNWLDFTAEFEVLV